MNSTKFTDLQERFSVDDARSLVLQGWILLEIYKQKVPVPNQFPEELQERPVFILGKPTPGS